MAKGERGPWAGETWADMGDPSNGMSRDEQREALVGYEGIIEFVCSDFTEHNGTKGVNVGDAGQAACGWCRIRVAAGPIALEVNDKVYRVVRG